MKETLLDRNAEYYRDPTAGKAIRKLIPPKRKPPKPRTWVLVWTDLACQHTKISPSDTKPPEPMAKKPLEPNDYKNGGIKNGCPEIPESDQKTPA